MTLIHVSSLNFTYPDSVVRAVKNASFSIEEKSYTAILGSNGSGKSTLARLLCGFLTPDSGSIDVYTHKSIGEYFSLLEKSKTQPDCPPPYGIVFQSPRDQIIAGTVIRDTSFGPENIRIPKQERLQRAETALNVTGLLSKLEDSTTALSLGQVQKLALSGILALSPEILVLDESLSMIDPSSRAEILDYLDELHRSGTTIIHVTHDIDEAKRADTILAVDDGEIVYNGPAKTLDSMPLCASLFFANTVPPAPQPIFTPDQKAAHALFFDNISFHYEDGSPLFQNLSLHIEKGMLTAFTGPSGSGKTTLFEIAAGLLSPSDGAVYALSRPSLALQDSESALFESFAADDVSFGPRNAGLPMPDQIRIVKQSMEMTGLSFKKFAKRRTIDMSGGEKRKLSLAGIIALDTDIILFDEPTAGLDPESRATIMMTLRRLTEQGKTVVFSTHRSEEALFADRIVDFRSGTIQKDTHKPFFEENAEGLYLQKPRAQTSMLSGLRRSSAGEYRKKNTIIHRLPPLVKYLVFLTLFGFSIFTRRIDLLGICLAAGAVYAALARYPFLTIIKRTAVMAPWIAVLAVLQVFILPPQSGDTILYSLGSFAVTIEKLITAARTFLHAVGAILSVSVFLYSIDEGEILDGMKQLLAPLRALGIPSHYTAMTVGIVFRFFPILTAEAGQIIKAQIVRGGFSQEKGLFKKIRSLLPLFVPLILQTLKRASAVADTLTARYFV